MKQIKDIIRQTEIAALIFEKPNFYSKEDLCDKFSINQPKLERDFKTLRESGVSIWSRKRKVDIDIKIKSLNDILTTYISVYTPYNIRNLKFMINKFKGRVISIFVCILKSINDRRCLQIDYIHSDSGKSERHIIEPIYLNFTNKTFYIIAYETGVVKFYRIEGIESFMITPRKFSRATPALSDIYKNTWGIYSGGEEIIAELKFNKDKENYFKHRYLADDQEIRYVPDGILIKLKVKLSFEFISWVMGWGKEVKIISPEKLKNQLILKAQGLIESNKS